MKRIAILFACLAILCLSTCENEQLITLLRAPSELVSLEIVAYAGDTQLEGGAAMEPGFTTSVFNYTVYVSKDTDRFTVNAAINGNGTIEVMCEEDQEIGTEFDFLDDEKVMILTVEREYMEEAEYRVTVIREETVPTATGVEISVTPEIGAFFVGSGVIPELKVTARPPAAGGTLSYQWYVNTENSNRGGSRINRATGATYRMHSADTELAQTMYYYAEITNTIDGKTGITESLPCRVTFLDKEEELHEKSRAMVNIPAGTIGAGIAWHSSLKTPWSTPGFSMGKNPVTWELWKLVADYADEGGYRFARSGNQGAETTANGGTNANPKPVGNKLHPVTMIGLRDAIVWCNAYSEMDGREPVYRDSEGNVLRDSRMAVELLIDELKITGKNGYRLPTAEEWYYAARGASPGTTAPWTNQYPGTNTTSNLSQFLWSYVNSSQTGEVGSREPNSIGLCDIFGMVFQWVWWSENLSLGYVYGAGLTFTQNNVTNDNYNFNGNWNSRANPFTGTDLAANYYGLRIVEGGLQ